MGVLFLEAYSCLVVDCAVFRIFRYHLKHVQIDLFNCLRNMISFFIISTLSSSMFGNLEP